MLRALTVAALATLTTLAAGCGEDEDATGSRSDASSDVSLPDAPADAQTDAGSDATPGDADGGEDVEVSADASDDADAPGDADAVADASASSDADAGAGLGIMSVASLAAVLPTKNFLMLNVHVPYAGEIPGTDKNLSYQDVPGIEAFIGTNKGVEVVLYCYSNTMALLAGNALLADGYTNVRYVDGGLNAWKLAGYPVEFHDN